MSAESQRLRDGIRSGEIACRCGRPADFNGGDYHRPECAWANAIREIYRIERLEEEGLCGVSSTV